ncbi:MAG: hypothetical protein IJB30_01095 [Clostridia bacterium]|nr:hypothetical protein [Clostridia bacterium]MBQ4610307.1 hypothetical protein [Clostridia bacterium]MBQ6703250.1 hypothetical protein [Clostridia bacterium]
MFGKKELQAALEQKEREIKELNAKIAEYQSRNEAVVSALTDAKAAANRILGAAEVKRDEIIARANQEKAEIEAQRDGIIEAANAEAEAIIKAAEAKAKQAEERADFFMGYIRDAADAVRRQAEGYESFLRDYEGAGVGAVPYAETVETPDEYRNPAELMHSIYSIQGRDIPETVKEQEAAVNEEPAEEERIWTIDQVKDDTGAEMSPEAAFVEKELNDILNDILKLD